MSVVTQFPPATSAEAIRWFSHKLHLETDCADVHSAQLSPDVTCQARSISRTARSPPSEWRPGRRRPSLWSTAPGRTATALTLPR